MARSRAVSAPPAATAPARRRKPARSSPPVRPPAGRRTLTCQTSIAVSRTAANACQLIRLSPAIETGPV